MFIADPLLEPITTITTPPSTTVPPPPLRSTTSTRLAALAPLRPRAATNTSTNTTDYTTTTTSATPFLGAHSILLSHVPKSQRSGGVPRRHALRPEPPLGDVLPCGIHPHPGRPWGELAGFRTRPFPAGLCFLATAGAVGPPVAWGGAGACPVSLSHPRSPACG